jgi:hypothetical protein
MIVLRVPLGDKPQDRTLHPKVKQTKVSHGRNSEHPDPKGDVSETMHNKWR